LRGGSGLGSVDYLLAITAWLSVSSASILVLLSGTSALVCAFWRLVIATAVIAAYSALTGQLALSCSRNCLILSTAAGFFLATHFLTWMESLFHVPVSLSTPIIVLYPIIALAYETALGLSRPSRREVEGMLVAFIGTLIAVRPYVTGGSLLGVLLATLGALTGAAYFTLGRFLRRSGVSLANYTTLCYSSAALVLLCYSVALSQPLLPRSSTSWLYLLLLALVPMIGGHTVMNYLMKRFKSYVVSAIGFGEAPGATILASLLLSQSVDLNVVAGMLISIAGALYTIRVSAGTS
jgi:drug/metabolite transporter (DMT)-like permease